MTLENKIEVKVDSNEKCICYVDPDATLGQIYDFACILRSYVLQKMQEEEAKQEKKD